MLNSRQRAQLRGLANPINATFQIGKSGIVPNMVKQVCDALEAHELVKIHVLENCPLDTREACGQMADLTGADPVQVIGRKFIIYKASEENPEIVLVK